MGRLFQGFIARLRQFRIVEDGVAAVEFALVLPIMLILYIGATEAGTLISMDRRVQSVSGAVGDLVARSNSSITASTLTDYFKAAGGIITPFPSDTLRQIVTQVDVSSAGVAKVAWCRIYASNTYSVCPNRAVNSIYPLPTAMSDISKGKSIIVAEAAYTYTPLYGIVFKSSIQLYRENFFLPRFGGTITLN